MLKWAWTKTYMIKIEWQNYFIIFHSSRKLSNLMTFNYSINNLKVKAQRAVYSRTAGWNAFCAPNTQGSRATPGHSWVLQPQQWGKVTQAGQMVRTDNVLPSVRTEGKMRNSSELCGERMSRARRCCRCPCSLWEPHDRVTPCNQWTVDESPRRTSKFLAEEEPPQDLVSWQELQPVEEPCWRWRPDGLYPLERIHAEEALKELQPVGRTHLGAGCESLVLGGTQCWSMGTVWGKRSSRVKLLWTNHSSPCPISLHHSGRGGGDRRFHKGMKLSQGRRKGER